MPQKKFFIVLGLGTFGSALAEQLHKNGCRVTGVDADRSRVENLKDVLYEAVVGDVTSRDTLAELSLDACDAVFISLGESQNIAPSLLATLHCRELGARRIIVKGLSREHAKILEALGVDRVVFPETEIAVSLADRMAWPNVLDFMPIDPEYTFVEIAVPDSMIGQTLRETDLRRLYNVWVVGVKDALTGKLALFPDAEYRLGVDQLLVVVARRKDLNRFRELK
ncbi:MAG: TrkA family potassium uptake protein [Candidatus Anammoximicrobium sp.]|nr:TrkA family potassium uptake protein [Candidatus Anammoximicrobium sp.]